MLQPTKRSSLFSAGEIRTEDSGSSDADADVDVDVKIATPLEVRQTLSSLKRLRFFLMRLFVSAYSQGCQIFLDAIYQNRGKIYLIITKLPNVYTIYQSAGKYPERA
jgi:hypothetical protein